MGFRGIWKNIENPPKSPFQKGDFELGYPNPFGVRGDFFDGYGVLEELGDC
jgi:hypothetical protein